MMQRGILAGGGNNTKRLTFTEQLIREDEAIVALRTVSTMLIAGIPHFLMSNRHTDADCRLWRLS